MKKLFTSILAATTVAACGGSKTDNTTKGSKTGALAIIVSEKSNEFFTDMIKGAVAQTGKYSGKEIQVFDSQSKSENEMTNVKTAITNGAKVLLLNVENSETSKAAVEYAISKDVKVVLLDRTLKRWSSCGFRSNFHW